MARRSYETALQPHKLAKDYGDPTPGIIRVLLLSAQEHHKNRAHHETGAYLQAAVYALDGWLQLQQDGCEKARELHRSWRTLNPTNTRPRGQVDELRSVNNARPGAGAGELQNENTSRQAFTSSKADNGNTAGSPLVCSCGHYDDVHVSAGKGGCRVPRCGCAYFGQPHVPARRPMPLCRCGHSYEAHTDRFGDMCSCQAADENDDDCECDGYETVTP